MKEDRTRNVVRRPVLRYHGGKWLLADWIISHFPKHRCYVEPFGGAASVLMKKERSYAEVYNDLDGELVNLFRVIRDRGNDLKNAIHFTPFSRSEFLESYERSDDALEQARRTVVRSFMGFGSNSHNKKTGFRSNSNRSGTTPSHDWRNLPDAYPWMIDRLRGVVIENRDAMQVMATHDSPETLHYVDPPYVFATRDRGSDYRHELSDNDHVELARFLNSLKGMVIVSGYDCPLYKEVFQDWRQVQRKSLADGARSRVEVLWMRNFTSERMLF